MEQSRLIETCTKAQLPSIAAGQSDAYEADAKVTTAGVRRIGTSTPIGENDLFALGSLTKAVTMTLVAMLIRSGLFDWTWTISRLLPDVEMHASNRETTVAQLASHRSGLEVSYLFRPLYVYKVWSGKSTETVMTEREKEVKRILSLPSNKKKSFSYGGGNYLTLAFIIERVCADEVSRMSPNTHVNAQVEGNAPAVLEKERESFESIMKARIFEPLEMHSARFQQLLENETQQPAPHIPNLIPGFKNPLAVDWLPRKFATIPEILSPGGGLICNIGDYLKFARVHARRGLSERSEISNAGKDVQNGNSIHEESLGLLEEDFHVLHTPYLELYGDSSPATAKYEASTTMADGYTPGGWIRSSFRCNSTTRDNSVTGTGREGQRPAREEGQAQKSSYESKKVKHEYTLSHSGANICYMSHARVDVLINHDHENGTQEAVQVKSRVYVTATNCALPHAQNTVKGVVNAQAALFQT